jgi:hypothetical protein
MSEFPKKGMYYEDVRARLRKYESIKKLGNKNMYTSLLRQAAECEGQKAAFELDKEFNSPKRKSNFSGNYNRSCGIGTGKREKEAGRYTYKNGQWIKVK